MELEENGVNKERSGGGIEVREGDLMRRNESAADGKKDGRNGKIRRAKFDDLDAIMDINDKIYDSADYMPALFYTFMHSKLHVIYVYEEDGRLISLSNFRFYLGWVDLVTWMSIRVRPSHQGRGLGSSESSPLIRQLLKQHKNITRYVLDTFYKANIRATMHRRKLIYHWTFLPYRPSDRQSLYRSTRIRQMAFDHLPPFTLSYTKAIEWLEHSDLLLSFISKYVKNLIPTGPAWMPLPVSKTGLRELFSTTNVAVSLGPGGTKASASDARRCSETLIQRMGRFRIEENGSLRMGSSEVPDEIIGLSYSSVFQCKYGVIIEFYFYGDCEKTLLSHVYNDLLHYVTVTFDNVRLGINLNFPLAINTQDVEEQLNDVLGDKITSDCYSTTQAVQYMASLKQQAYNSNSE